MSRQGRAIDILNDWRDHPKGCTAEHGWSDGYDGMCTDDAFDVLQMIDWIDPFFRQTKERPAVGTWIYLEGTEDGPVPFEEGMTIPPGQHTLVIVPDDEEEA